MTENDSDREGEGKKEEEREKEREREVEKKGSDKLEKKQMIKMHEHTSSSPLLPIVALLHPLKCHVMYVM